MLEADGKTVGVNDDRLQFLSLYLVRFAGGFGLAALTTLLPTYINLYDPSALLLGLFTSGYTLASTLAIVPFAWGGDAGDKRTALVVAIGIATLAYTAFAFVSGSWQFVGARAMQGFAATGASLLSLSLVGELAPTGGRANHIGKANAARLASGIVGALSVGALYEVYGFQTVYAVLVALLVVSMVAVVLFVRPDPVRIEGFPFSSLSVNERLRTLTTFRGQYAVAVTLVRTWVPIYAGVEVAQGGLAYAPFAVGVVITAERGANMLFQPYTGRLSDRFGRAAFIALGGTGYGAIALAVPFTPGVGSVLALPPGIPGMEWLAATAPVKWVGVEAAVAGLGNLSPAFLPLIACNALLGIADAFREPASMALFADEGENTEGGGVASSFGIREFVWRPGSIGAPFVGGWLQTNVGIDWVFYLGGGAAFAAVAVFVLVLASQHGAGALRRW